nr:hypothetical protein Q903MT_gene1066 [Picea sitchensis]
MFCLPYNVDLGGAGVRVLLCQYVGRNNFKITVVQGAPINLTSGSVSPSENTSWIWLSS